MVLVRSLRFNVSLMPLKKAASAVNISDEFYCHQIGQEVGMKFSPVIKARLILIRFKKIVEDKLMASRYPEVARAYIEYRHDRDLAREKRSQLTKEIEGLIEQSNVELLNENANKDAKVIPTQRDLLAGIVAKHYAKHNILPRDVVEAHEKVKFIITI